jgi:DNA-directed RNA polymerase specialized sigma24 family protein
VPAEIAGQRPLLERAVAGDREAFAQLYDVQVEGVYRYLLAWTGDRRQAADLTGQVFHTALGWLPTASSRGEELGAWLIALARDAVAGHRGSPGSDDPAGGAVGAVARLGDPEREVVVLRLLLGHSLAHTAHLSNYSQRAVLELQLTACLTVSELTGDAPAGPGARTAASAEEFERRLGPWETDPTGSDPPLASALAAVGTLRQAIPGYVVAPTPDLVEQLRQDLLTTPTPAPPGPAVHGGPAGGTGAGRLSTGSFLGSLFRRPWVATGVATAGIIVVLALQAFGEPGRPVTGPTSTTLTVAAGGTSLGTPLTTVLEPSTTPSSTQPAQDPATSAPRATTPPAPPSSRPATSSPQTTRPPSPTTTRAPTTTVATTTTAAVTTTTSAPIPT